MFDSCLPLLGKHISLGYMIILMAMDGTEIINEINIYIKRRQTDCVINDSTLFSLLMHGLYNQNSSTSTHHIIHRISVTKHKISYFQTVSNTANGYFSQKLSIDLKFINSC